MLLRLTSPRRDDPLRDALEEALAEAFNAGAVADAVVAQSETQALDLWQMRESIPEAQKHEGGSIKNDVSLPLSRVVGFYRAGDRRSTVRVARYPWFAPSATWATATSTST